MANPFEQFSNNKKESNPDTHKTKLSKSQVDDEISMMAYTDDVKVFSAAIKFEEETQKINSLFNEEKISADEYGKILKEYLSKLNETTLSLAGKIKDDRQNEIIDIAKRRLELRMSNNILEATSFNDLYSNINKFRVMECSDGKNRLPKEYISIIETVRNKAADVNSIPEPNDVDVSIKRKVEQLMKKDGIGSDLPPDTEWLTEKDIKDININFKKTDSYLSINMSTGLREMFGELPEIGAYGSKTKYGQINGKLIWCDGVMAIFETRQGKIKMPFKELVAPSGITYGQIEDKWNQEHRERKKSGLKYRHM